MYVSYATRLACRAKLLMNEMRSERLSRLSASTLVNEAMSASTRQSMRMVECVDAMCSSTPWASWPSPPAMCSLSHAQLWLSSLMPPKRLSSAVSCMAQTHGPCPRERSWV